MLRSLRTAEKAMQFEQVRIDALANNLANVDATGFRQILTRVAQQNATGVDNSGPDGLPLGPDRQPVQIDAKDSWVPDLGVEMYHATDVRNGPLRSTGRDGDLAILGEGFFVVQAGEEELYTRAGGLQLNETRQLVTPDGNPVLGAGGPITIEGDKFTVDVNGTVVVDGSTAGRLKLVNFSDPTLLEHRGNSLLAAPEEISAEPIPPEQVSISQGQLEGSNVNAIDTLVDMIAAQRSFEIESKIMSANDEMLGKSVNQLARVT